MIKILLSLLGLITISPIAKAELNVYESIDVSANYFIELWRTDSFLNKTQVPQIIRFSSGNENTIWGGCWDQDASGRWIHKTHLHKYGSSYCSETDTIYLISDQIEKFYFDHGDAAPFFLLSHELAHALQSRLGFTRKNMAKHNHELQADCIAGMLSRDAEDKLSIDQSDIEEMSNAAWSVGDKQPYSVSHGTPEQRRYAFRTGFYEGTCQPEDVQQIIALNPKQILNSAYGSSISLLKNYKKSPYQKTFSDLTPMVGIQHPKRLHNKSSSKEFSFIHDLLETWKNFKMKIKEVNRIISN